MSNVYLVIGLVLVAAIFMFIASIDVHVGRVPMGETIGVGEYFNCLGDICHGVLKIENVSL